MSENCIILQNNDIWMEVMWLNTITNDIKILKRYDGIRISGHYATINGTLVMFYRKNKSLYINVENNEICLDDDNNITFIITCIIQLSLWDGWIMLFLSFIFIYGAKLIGSVIIH